MLWVDDVNSLEVNKLKLQVIKSHCKDVWGRKVPIGVRRQQDWSISDIGEDDDCEAGQSGQRKTFKGETIGVMAVDIYRSCLSCSCKMSSSEAKIVKCTNVVLWWVLKSAHQLHPPNLRTTEAHGGIRHSVTAFGSQVLPACSWNNQLQYRRNASVCWTSHFHNYEHFGCCYMLSTWQKNCLLFSRLPCSCILKCIIGARASQCSLHCKW